MKGKTNRHSQRHSRTPEDELAKKLEDPRPLKHASEVELQTLTPTKEVEQSSHTEPAQDQDIDCPSGHPSPIERADSPSMLALIEEEIGRAVQQECRDRSRMPSSA
eukprot:TRINITY_DN15218_c0_g1_i1.p1 TRINITY_DN15218_c0_g1~~TRINITY_DN15218_c0_g1_i1.p1  ORF type:complete len:106 (+),score=20.04 TRINITY_DN15218_c0_g1_i1:131-448(+)